MRTRRHDGVELWWDAVGDGPPVVLVPGRGDSTDLFPTDVIEPLVAADRRVIRFDPRDTGLSDAGGDTYTMATMVDDAVAILDEACGADAAAHWIGISMGGLHLVDVATRHAGRVASLAFVSAMSPDPDAADQHMAAAMRLGWPTMDDLTAIDVPTLVVHGTVDRTLPLAHAECLANRIDGARLVIRDGMGHLPRRHDWVAIVDELPVPQRLPDPG